MDSRSDELDRFKRDINLTALAAGEGFEIDRRASCRNSVVMRRPGGEKIVVARGQDGHWVYFNVHDADDSGTVIDFVANRLGLNLGHVRKHLRTWQSLPALPPSAYVPTLEPITRDLVAVRAQYETTKPLAYGEHEYLNRKRRLSPLLLSRPAFVEAVRVDCRGNAVFPHRNRDGVCGMELRNHDFRGFAKHGVKGLWLSSVSGDEPTLALFEGTIDALSYAAIHGPDGLRLMSVAGAMSPDQRALVRGAIAKFGGNRVVIATDNDKGGDVLADELRACFEAAGRHDLEIVVDRPPCRGQDWNDVLRKSPPTPILSPSPD